MLQFETANLFYKPLDEIDRELFIDLYTDKAIMKYIDTPMSAEKADRFFQKGLLASSKHQYSLSIREKSTKQKVGIVGISKLSGQKVNLGILLKRQFHRKGYPLEALDGLIKQHRQLSSNTIFCTEIHNKNFPAKALMRKLGFTEQNIQAEKCFWELPVNV